MKKRPRQVSKEDAEKALVRATEQLGIDSTAVPVCRDEQMSIVRDFLKGTGKGTVVHPMLQLFGLPGTGKTAVVKHALSELANDDVTTLFINGYLLQRPNEVYSRLYQHMSLHRLGKADNLPPEAAMRALDKRFNDDWRHPSRPKQLCVVVVDEMDRCVEGTGKVLHRLADWMVPKPNRDPRCRLITIANAMQLPESMESKTRSRLNTTARVTFDAYTCNELERILHERVGAITPAVFAPAAVKMICTNIANQHGDVRRLLQTMSNAVHSVLCQDILIVRFEEGLLSWSGGILKTPDVFAVAKFVLQDRFKDFFTPTRSPWVLLIIAVIARDIRRRGDMENSLMLPLTQLHDLALDAVAAHGMDMGLDRTHVKPRDWHVAVAMLQDVGMIELVDVDGDAVGKNAAQTTSEVLHVSLLQPYSDLVTLCELNVHGAQLKKILAM
jgi:origin recognition complex subunit 1